MIGHSTQYISTAPESSGGVLLTLLQCLSIVTVLNFIHLLAMGVAETPELNN